MNVNGLVISLYSCGNLFHSSAEEYARVVFRKSIVGVEMRSLMRLFFFFKCLMLHLNNNQMCLGVS